MQTTEFVLKVTVTERENQLPPMVMVRVDNVRTVALPRAKKRKWWKRG